MIKPFIFFIFLSLLFIFTKAWSQTNNIVIKGNIQGLNSKWVYLYNTYPVRSPAIDSAKVVNHQFKFTFQPDTVFLPNLINIKYFDENKKAKYFSVKDPVRPKNIKRDFIMELGLTILEGTISKNEGLKLTSGKQNEFYFKNSDLPFRAIVKDSFKRKIEFENIRSIIKEEPNAWWTLFAFRNLRYLFNKQQLQEMFVEFSDNIKRSYEGRKLASFIGFVREKESFLPNSLFVDNDNNQVKLIDTSKRLNIIIFWASWCGPCREEIPSLKRIASEMSSKDARMVSVTIDVDRNKWLKAVTQENMPWQQLFIPTEVRQKAVAQYNLFLVPQIYFVDNNNTILKKVMGLADENEKSIKLFISQYLSK